MSFIPITEKPGFFRQLHDDRLWKFFPSNEPGILGHYHTVDETGTPISTDSIEDDEITINELMQPLELSTLEANRKITEGKYYSGTEFDEIVNQPDGIDRLNGEA